MEERQPEKRNDKNNDRRNNRHRHRSRGNRSGGGKEGGQRDGERGPSTRPDEIMAYVDEAPDNNQLEGVVATPSDSETTRSEIPRPERPERNRPENGRQQGGRQESGRQESGRQESGQPENNRQSGERQRSERSDRNRQRPERETENRSESGRPEQPNQRDRERNRDRDRDRNRDQERPSRNEPAVVQEWAREDEWRPGDLRPGESRMGEMKITDLAGRGADVAPEDRLVVGITLGDYNGIGPEVILKALQYNQLQRVCTPVIYGSMRVLNRYRNLLNLKDWNLNGIQHVGQASHKMTNVITCWNENARPAPATPSVEENKAEEADETASTEEPVAEVADQPAAQPETTAPPAQPVYEIQPGKVTPEAGQAALACLQRAVDDLKAGKIDALITGPINKHNIQSETFKFPGHTEYLAEAFGVPDDLMFMVGETLRIGVVTGHVPLGRVRQHVTRNAINQKLTMMMQSLRQDFGIQKPRIAVLGLNPHAGENGLLGNEEQETITPVIEDWRKKGELVYGPFPADGFFGTRAYRKYDAVLAMYHDQGLIPFKAIAFDEGVNFTAGLPIVRTSPDHGTAYDIAGKNMADETSMTQAIYLACDVARRRKEYKETEANALKK